MKKIDLNSENIKSNGLKQMMPFGFGKLRAE